RRTAGIKLEAAEIDCARPWIAQIARKECRIQPRTTRSTRNFTFETPVKGFPTSDDVVPMLERTVVERGLQGLDGFAHGGRAIAEGRARDWQAQAPRSAGLARAVRGPKRSPSRPVGMLIGSTTL